MNKGYRNVVFIGFTKEEQKEIKIKDARKQKENWFMMASHLHRFPYVVYLDNIKEALKHQGFIIFLKNEDEQNIKKYYKTLIRKYYHVILCTTEIINPDLGVETINIQRLYEEKIIRDLNSWYYRYLKEEEYKKELNAKINNNPKKGAIAGELKAYIKEKENFTAKEISKHFNIPLRTAQRHINYMNEIYENVKYDVKTKTWYVK